MASIEEKLTLVGLPKVGQISHKTIGVAAELEDFQRAEHNVERMKELRKAIMEQVKDRFRFDSYAGDIVRRDLRVNGEKIAEVQGERRFKKSPYKGIMEGMETLLLGIAYHVGNGGSLYNVTRDRENPMIEAQHLLDEFGIVLGGHLNPGVEYNVTPTVQWQQPTTYLVVPAKADRKLSANSIVLLAQIDAALDVEEKYVKAYKRAASRGATDDAPRVTAASVDTAVEGDSVEKAQVDYTNVVRTLIDVPMQHHERQWDPELPYLVSEEFSLDELKELMPWYDLEQKRASSRMDAGIYIGIRGVYDRIQELKEEGHRTIKVPTAKVRKIF